MAVPRGGRRVSFWRGTPRTERGGHRDAWEAWVAMERQKSKKQGRKPNQRKKGK
jgi:hypothetical protein